MDETYLAWPGSGPADGSIAADVLLREEPDEEEEDGSEDSSSTCELAMPCVLLSGIGLVSDAELSDCTRDRRPRTWRGGGMCRDFLESGTSIQTRC